MNVYFATNSNALRNLGQRYLEHLMISVASCRIKSPSLSPYLLYDSNGEQFDQSYFEKLGKFCAIIPTRLSRYDQLKECCKENKVNFNVASGAYLRLDIPDFESNKYCLYCDTDVHFRSDIDIPSITKKLKIRYFAAAPEIDINSYVNINSGVMLIKVGKMRKTRDDFFNFIFSRKLKSSTNDPYDQGHLNDFYRGKISQLDPIYNWKPYWGFHNDAKIVHWHGCKYPAAKAIITGKVEQLNFKPHENLFAMNPDGYLRYLNEFEEFKRAVSFA